MCFVKDGSHTPILDHEADLFDPKEHFNFGLEPEIEDVTLKFDTAELLIFQVFCFMGSLGFVILLCGIKSDVVKRNIFLMFWLSVFLMTIYLWTVIKSHGGRVCSGEYITSEEQLRKIGQIKKNLITDLNNSTHSHLIHRHAFYLLERGKQLKIQAILFTMYWVLSTLLSMVYIISKPRVSDDSYQRAQSRFQIDLV